MLLRWLVSNYVRQAAEQQVHRVLESAVSGGSEDVDRTGHSKSPTPRCDVALFFALPIEAGGMIDRLSACQTTRWASHVEHVGFWDERRVVVGVSGAGSEAASRAAEDLLAVHRPLWVIAAGFAASLDVRLRRGHVLMPDVIRSEDGEERSVGFKIDPQVIAGTPGLHVGRLLSIDRLVLSASERRRLADHTGALACDNETAAVAEVCRKQKTRFLAIRMISDEIDDELPAELAHLLSQQTLAGKLGAVTGALFKRPANIKLMWQMRDDAGRASDGLAAFVVGILRQLPALPAAAL